MLIKELYEKLHRLLDLNRCIDENYQRKPINKELVELVYNDQKRECFLCGCKTSVPLTHHIQPDGESNRDNLIMLCPLCHQWVHWILKKNFGYRGTANRIW